MNIFYLPIMTYIIIFIVLILFAVLSAKVNKDSYNYEKINFLFTPAEKKFLMVL